MPPFGSKKWFLVSLWQLAGFRSAGVVSCRSQHRTGRDFIYIPPYCAHKRFNTDAENEARVIVINSRMMKAIGFDWFDQLEPAEGFEELWVPPED